LREQRRRFEAEMKLFDLQQEREKQELEQMAEDLTRLHMTAGHQSEPTTPPEYRDQVFPSALSRPNRFSTSSLTSPLGVGNRTFRSGSQLASPPSDLVQSPQHQVTANKLPSKSVPGSRRGSNDKDKVYVPESTITNPRAKAVYVHKSQDVSPHFRFLASHMTDGLSEAAMCLSIHPFKAIRSPEHSSHRLAFSVKTET